ncbi:hypothetical protein BO71DRAFT_76996 [Aspergillus ellipticus CBS 707.79]|uniref:Uncharacterized protein n=1 Tax=Aspergillus ellipticus CBS 707.79 TaxID=1448320 RepID=A0A319D761_9EURO|nr:hypothetical protein BO71DRAFT_76996 [Aspergillus ellipticus CBS 707.79]
MRRARRTQSANAAGPESVRPTLPSLENSEPWHPNHHLHPILMMMAWCESTCQVPPPSAPVAYTNCHASQQWSIPARQEKSRKISILSYSFFGGGPVRNVAVASYLAISSHRKYHDNPTHLPSTPYLGTLYLAPHPHTFILVR